MSRAESRGGSRTTATSRWKPLTVITKNLILDFAVALDPASVKSLHCDQRTGKRKEGKTEKEWREKRQLLFSNCNIYFSVTVRNSELL